MVGCPKCGDTDIQVMELLAAWKKIDELETALAAITTTSNSMVGFAVEPIPPVESALETLNTTAQNIPLTIEEQSWKTKYEKIKEAYVRTRLEVSGSFGNWDYATRKRVLEHELSSELGFLV